MRQGASGRGASSSRNVKMTSCTELSKPTVSAKQACESPGPTGKRAQGQCGVGQAA